jgi:hypothetical protein
LFLCLAEERTATLDEQLPPGAITMLVIVAGECLLGADG